MKALMLKEYMKLSFEDVPNPKIGPNDVLIQVKACGICGSDIHGMDGSTGRRLPPIIMGHEASGVIAEIGDKVEGWQPGQRVTFDSMLYCGSCFFCRQGKTNCCDQRQVLGVSCQEFRYHGAFAEYVVVPQHILCELPSDLPFEYAALVEPLAVAVHAVERTPISLNDTAVVIGTGMVGLLVVQALRVAGCGEIIAVDLDQNRLDLACELGATVGLKVDDCDIVAEVQKRTGGHGAQVAIEVVGTTPAVQTAVGVLRKGGALTIVGNLSPTVELPLQAVVTRELSVYGACASCGEYQACLEMMARGTIQAKPLISATAPLAEGADWFQRLYKNEDKLMKVVLNP